MGGGNEGGGGEQKVEVRGRGAGGGGVGGWMCVIVEGRRGSSAEGVLYHPA